MALLACTNISLLWSANARQDQQVGGVGGDEIPAGCPTLRPRGLAVLGKLRGGG